MKSGNLNFLEPSGPLQACNGTALPFFTSKTCTQLSSTQYVLHDGPSYYSRFGRSTNIWWGVQIRQLSLCNLLHFLVTSSPLGPNIFLSPLLSNNFRLYSSLSVRNQVLYLYKTRKIIFFSCFSGARIITHIIIVQNFTKISDLNL